MAYEDPAAAEQAFYDAFRQLDLAQMKEVWMDSDDASCIHPGGELLQGSEAILKSWAAMFNDSMPPRVDHRLIQASSDNHLAVHTFEEKVSSGAGHRRAIILATNIYAWASDGWRLLAHHASLPLVETTRDPPEEPETGKLH
jgi:ketosteroid isomerase-like protein